MLRLHRSKVLVELFQKLTGAGQRPAKRLTRTTHKSCPPMHQLHRSKVLVELFQKLTGAGRRPAKRLMYTAHQSCRLYSDLHRSKVLPPLFIGSIARRWLVYETVARLRDGGSFTRRWLACETVVRGLPEPQAVRRGALRSV